MRSIDKIIKTRDDAVSGFRHISATGDTRIVRMAQDINGLLHALVEKDAEIAQLRDLSQRLEEAEYGMVAGNGAHEAIPWECADGWFYYVRTGKSRTK